MKMKKKIKKSEVGKGGRIFKGILSNLKMVIHSIFENFREKKVNQLSKDKEELRMRE